MRRDAHPTPTRTAAPPAPRLRVTPLARALARAHGIDLAALVGTGPDGRVLARDVRARLTPLAPATAAPAPPTPPRSVPPAVLAQAMPTGIAQGRDSPDAATPAPPVSSAAPVTTVTLEFDAGAALARIAALDTAYARQGLPLRLEVYVAAVALELLPAHPRLNARWLGDTLALRRRVHLALANAGPEGLRWTLIADAGNLSLHGLARALGAPPGADAATFALVSLAGGKSWWSAPPPLPGTVAALTLGAPERRVVVVEGGLSVRPMATLTLSYDARALDQRQALDFLNALRTRLEERAPI
ncbi:MAG: 2-oxo acid dehydrogenase subunit E2 [Chloroflexaceae bacterium]